jgi:hypothetical protein
VKPLISPSAIRLSAARPEFLKGRLGRRGSHEKIAIRALAVSLVARLRGRPPRKAAEWPGAERPRYPVASQRGSHT